MNWFDWIVAGWLAYSALMVVVNVGKPRQPTTPGLAAMCIVIVTVLIVGMVVV